MKITHRVGFSATDGGSRDLLTSLGILFKEQPLVATFEIEESDVRWPAVQAWIERCKPSDITWTSFTRAEITAARWLALQATWHQGYPQPDEENFGYRQATYDLSGWCPACGIGMRQAAPFQMKKEPAWGRNSLLQLNWVFDEFFTTPDLWQSVFRPRAVGVCPVLGPRGRELTTVVQLVVEETVPVVTEGLSDRRCADCGRLKYLPVTRGFFPKLTAAPVGSMVKTAEYFGSGGSAFQQILVNADIGKALTGAGAKGAALVPVAF